jgi:hypothetical protein
VRPTKNFAWHHRVGEASLDDKKAAGENDGSRERRNR